MRFNKILIIAAGFSFMLAGCSQKFCDNTTAWVDIYEGEPVLYSDIISDISTVDVVYIGERHGLKRHHDLQLDIIKSISEADRKIVLGMEQLGAHNQDVLDRYNTGYITTEELILETNWHSEWSNYKDYVPLVEQVRSAGGMIVGLNAKAQTIRRIARGGLDSLDEAARSELPEYMDFDKPEYREYLSNVMMVMAHVKNEPEFLERMFIAQMCRDEVMAENLYRALKDLDKEWIAVVVCGSGHVRNGAGMPQSLRARMPDINDRIIVLSESGELELSERQMAMSRKPSEINRLRCFTMPIADYVHLVLQD